MEMTAGERIFIDTNILLTASDSSREDYSFAQGIFNKIAISGCHPISSGQVLREYLVVATRPKNANGLGLSPGDAVHNIKEFEKRITIYEERKSTADLLQHLVVRYQLKGKRIHDANIAATMKTHGISFLLTQNTADFKCFDEIKAFTIGGIEKELG